MRHLFGPVDGAFADQNLYHARARGDCLTFGSGADLDLPADVGWPEIEAHLPAGWRPDFVTLWLAYTRLPEWVWSAPVPVVGLAADWNLLWHEYRAGPLPRCDSVLTDEAGVEMMRRAGYGHVRYANLFGLERAYLEEEWPKAERDIDVFFAGNLHSSVQRERLAWLGRIAQLGDRWNVRIATGVFGREYRDLLRRSRVVFNRSIRGECNRRAFEAPACGALMMMEAENLEVRRWLNEGTEFVAYTAESLATVLEQYLTDEPRRVGIAEAGRARVARYCFDELWANALDELDAEWDLLRDRARARLARTEAAPPRPNPVSLLGRMAAVEEAGRVGHVEDALRLGRTTLLEIDGAATALRDTLDLQPWRGFSPSRVEWERAAWRHAGDPGGEGAAKSNLLRWRLHLALADAADDVAHHYEAVLTRPDLPGSRAALGCALARRGRLAEALPHLRAAAAADPFDLAAARAYGQLLRDAGLTDTYAAYCRRRRLLAKAAPEVVPPEDWFAERPGVDALASIIVLCCNEAEITRACLNSVRRHTRPPYELVLVDNGSTDTTQSLLDEVRTWDGPERVDVIRNEVNRGYAAGVNQGLYAAKGQWHVLLNNDTLVTPGWLGGLIGVAIAEDAALVGPVSNYAPDPQHVPAGYAGPSGLDAFADGRRREFGGSALEHPRLTGFCMLLRRDALERIGALDERYGTGFFEDDDLCVRARRAGYRLRVALGTYIHHEGSRTFRALGLDAPALLRQNLDKFRQKWGEAEARPYRTPEAPAAPTPGVSLTMIVRNEEANLGDCLRSVRDLVTEMILVDTGSSDRTREIARALGAKVYEFPWVDDFAAARNEALGHATRRWVFWMDADDRLDEANRAKLRGLFSRLPDSNVAYSMKCRCAGEGEVVVDHVRLFRNDPRHRWRFRVHEQILPSLRATRSEVCFSEIEIRHVGYVDPALRARKLERDMRLLGLELRDRPDHPYALFNLGSALRETGRAADALPLLEKSLSLSHPRDSITRKLHALVAQCHLDLGRPAEALACCAAGREVYPDDPELLYADALARERAGDDGGAEASLRRLVDGREEGEHFASVSPALRGHLGRHRLAELLFRLDRLPEAEAQWRTALTDEPRFLPAWCGLGEVYLRSKNWAALDQAAGELGERCEADVLRGRAKLARKEFAAARWTLSQAAERFPRAVAPRLYLTHALLQEGKDWLAAERALRDVLTLDPQNEQARHNLEALLKNQRSA